MEQRRGYGFYPETELWAREDWQKVSSSLSHDAFIRRSSSPQRLVDGSLFLSFSLVFHLSRSPTTTYPRHTPSISYFLYLRLLRPEDDRQDELDHSLQAVALSNFSKSLFPFHSSTIHVRTQAAWFIFIFIPASKKGRNCRGSMKRRAKARKRPEGILPRRSVWNVSATSWNTHDR